MAFRPARRIESTNQLSPAESPGFGAGLRAHLGDHLGLCRDRSENADYQYGKRRLRQIDGRLRFLTKRIDAAEVVDPESPRPGQAAKRVFFGATVRYANAAGTERVVSIVGTDEVDLNRNHISWVSPLGRALMKSAAGDRVLLQAPGGTENLTVLEVRYERIPVEPFREPAGAEASAKGIPRRR